MSAVPQVAVVYATAAGSTEGIAARIALVLGRAGCEARCLPAGADLELPQVDGLVVGSAVHNMAWLPPAADFLRRAAMSDPVDVWCFSVGGVHPRGWFTRPLAALEARRVGAGFPVGLPVRDHRVFGGIVGQEGISLWGRLFFRMVGGRPGDHRDWTAIEGWASGIAEALTGSAVR